MDLSMSSVEAAVWGGAFLGGGGGGWPADGLRNGMLALETGSPRLVPLSELPADALVVTVSMVGAPAAPERFLRPEDFVEAVTVLNRRLDGRIGALISSENGGTATLNGWFQSAVTGIPVADAACDGRAHPTGVMGSMGLDRDSTYQSVQSVVGGNPASARRVRMVVEGSLDACDRSVREASVAAGGLVAVARNPVTAAYVMANGAPGAITQAMALGEIILGNRPAGGEAVAAALAAELGGHVLARGPVRQYALRTVGGYDVGQLRVGDVDLTFWNEYMTADGSTGRLATFPDLIATLDARTGDPVVTAELADGRELLVVAVPKARLILGEGVRHPECLAPAEAAVGKEMARWF
ncbi:MAG TPA: DUF917 family protein [Longimicrobiales bacterium]|nr:DUF917 family protein [Longimicrobiales bacterium]